jgi:hypothetical protein
METPRRIRPRPAQAGAITIMVALMMLILLTLAAVGMSRNSFREVINSGFSRQGAMAGNVADSGLEWSVYWITSTNSQSAAGASSNLVALKANLLLSPTLAGVAKSTTDPSGNTVYALGNPLSVQLPPALQAGMIAPALATPAGVVEGYTLGLTNMGKLPMTGMSQGSGQGAYTPAAGGPVSLAPDLWAIRADAQVQQGGVTFTHAKEAWVSTPVQ